MARFALVIADGEFPAPVTALVSDALAGIRDADFGAVLDAAAAISGLLESHDCERTGLTPDGRVILHRFATSVTEFSVALRAFRLYAGGQAPRRRRRRGVRQPGGDVRRLAARLGLRGGRRVTGARPGRAARAGQARALRADRDPDGHRRGPGDRRGRRAVRAAVLLGGDRRVHHLHGRQHRGRADPQELLADRGHVRRRDRRGGARAPGRRPGAAADRGRAGLALPRPLPVPYQLRVHDRRDHGHGVAAVRGAGRVLQRAAGAPAGGDRDRRRGRDRDRPAGAAAARRPGGPGGRPAAGRGARRPHRPVPGPAGRPGQRGRLRPGAARLRPPGGHGAPGDGGDGPADADAAVRRGWRRASPDSPRPPTPPGTTRATCCSTRPPGAPPSTPRPPPQLAAAGRQLDASIAAITSALAEDGPRRRAGYVSSAALFARVADRLPADAPLSRPQLALRDLELLDGALAEAARWAGVPVSQA